MNMKHQTYMKILANLAFFAFSWQGPKLYMFFYKETIEKSDIDEKNLAGTFGDLGLDYTADLHIFLSNTFYESKGRKLLRKRKFLIGVEETNLKSTADFSCE